MVRGRRGVVRCVRECTRLGRDRRRSTAGQWIWDMKSRASGHIDVSRGISLIWGIGRRVRGTWWTDSLILNLTVAIEVAEAVAI